MEAALWWALYVELFCHWTSEEDFPCLNTGAEPASDFVRHQKLDDEQSQKT